MSLNVLLSFHSSSQPLANTLADTFKSLGFEIYMITENAPDKLSSRAQYINICDTFIVLASRSYQKSEPCMELINYAKDVKKSIYGVNESMDGGGGSSSYVPFGALGAILCGANGITQTDEPSQLSGQLKQLAETIKSSVKPKPVKHTSETRSMTPMCSLTFTNTKVDVLISHHPEAVGVAGLILEAINANKVGMVVLEDSANATATSVTGARALVVVMSPGYEASHSCRMVVEAARARSIQVVPVSTSREWKPSAWLGLLIAGKRFYRIFSHEQAYKKKYDSTPMNDLVFEVNKALSPRPGLSEREKALVESLRTRVDECKAKLPHWPPKKHERKRVERKPVKVKLDEPKADIDYTHIHYEVTRMSFAVPSPLFDNYGVPIRKIFDCMM
jgi:hypothetical protein